MGNMPNIAPLFSTAPRIKLKINGANIAFAIGLSINVSVNVQPVTVLGQFGPVTLEPTAYNTVTGTMQIMRLATREDMQSAANAAANIGLADGEAAKVATSTPSNTFVGEGSTLTDQFSSNNPVAQASLIRHMDPRTVLLSTTFNLDLYMKVPNPNGTSVGAAVNNDFTDDQDVLDSPLDLVPNRVTSALIEVPWLTVNQCRLTSRNVNISAGQLINEPVSFQGIFMTPKGVDEENIFQVDSGVQVTETEAVAAPVPASIA